MMSLPQNPTACTETHALHLNPTISIHSDPVRKSRVNTTDPIYYCSTCLGKSLPVSQSLSLNAPFEKISLSHLSPDTSSFFSSFHPLNMKETDASQVFCTYLYTEYLCILH